MLFGAFKHYPNAGFRASLYWKAFKDGHFSKVKASYTKNEVFSHRDGWLHVGRDNYTNKDRYLVNIDFHFSVYSYAGNYIYQISAGARPKRTSALPRVSSGKEFQWVSGALPAAAVVG